MVMIAAAALLLHVTRGESLISDEWNFFAYRRHGSEALFAPNQGGLDLVSLLVYRAVFRLFGPNTTILRFILVALELVCAGLFFELARQRVGDWIALGGATLLLFLGSGALLVTTVGITLYLAVAFGLAALIAIERRSLRADVAACGLLALAVASYSAALPFAAGAVIAIGLRPARLRWRRAWVVAAPLLGYGIWRIWAAHYAQHPKLPAVTEAIVAPGAITRAPGRIGEAFAAGLASATGLFRIGAAHTDIVNYTWGVPLAVLFVAAALARISWRRWPRPDCGAWAFVAMPLVYWAAVSLVAQRVPGTKLWQARAPNIAGYQYTSVVLILLAAAALAAGVRIPRPVRLALATVLLASLVANLLTLHEDAAAFRSNGASDRAELAAEALGPTTTVETLQRAPTAPTLTLPPISPQTLLSASADVGSPALPASSLPAASPAARGVADLTLIRMLELVPRPSDAIAARTAEARAPALESGAADLVQSGGGCISVIPRRPGTPLAFRLPRGGFTLRATKGAPVALYLRRFMDPPGLPIGSVAGGAGATVAIPADASAQPWRLLIYPVQPVRLCALPGTTVPPGQGRL
ncbi:MAG: hypothetical protein DLM64_08600 [Solirubrobacterales bacterium]|nr:MAG: hypothetical protein DLM64_08600 [Solirubrobacterales bacterium]